MTATFTASDKFSVTREMVLCCGMIRSGSTLQYKVVAELVERHGVGARVGFADQQTISGVQRDAEKIPGFAVVKAHEALPQLTGLLEQNQARCFYTFRDLRAVALSVMRKWSVPFAHVIARNGWLETAVNSSDRWLAAPTLCVSRYEEMLLALPGEVSKWAAALGLEISDDEAEELARDFSIARQKERIEKFRSGKAPGANDFDTRSLLDRDHIIDGSCDSWKTQLEAWQIRQIERKFADWQSSQGYKPVT